MLTVVGVTLLVVIAITAFRTRRHGRCALWAANALAVGVWLRSGRGLTYDLSFRRPDGALACWPASSWPEITPLSAAMFTVANMVEIVLAVALARRFAPTLNLATVAGRVSLHALRRGRGTDRGRTGRRRLALPAPRRRLPGRASRPGGSATPWVSPSSLPSCWRWTRGLCGPCSVHGARAETVLLFAMLVAVCAMHLSSSP